MILLGSIQADTIVYAQEPEERKVVQIEVVYTEERIIEKIRETFPESPDIAVAIAKAESSLNPDATNAKDSHKGCTGSYGLFQIGCIHGDKPEHLYDVDYNIQVARRLYLERGWQPWGAYTNKQYLKYI